MKPRHRISIATVVRKSCQRRWLVLLAALGLCLVAFFYIFTHFRMTSDTTELFSPKVDWRQREIAMIGLGEAVVIDGLFVAFRMFAFAVPAAIGVQEGAYVVLCALFGIGAPVALAFSLVRRARDLAVGAPAVLAWQLLERGRRASRRAVASS